MWHHLEMEEATGVIGASAHQVNRGKASTFGGGQDQRGHRTLTRGAQG